MRLVCCPNCRAQYDVAQARAEHFTCECGSAVAARVPREIERTAHRCGSCGALLEADASGCSYCGAAVEVAPDQAGTVCPGCYARNGATCRFCTACGIAFEPRPIPESRTELPCPACGALMPPGGVGRVPTHECPHCHGLWVPDDQFDHLVRQAIAACERAQLQDLAAPSPRVRGGRPDVGPVQYRRCPICQSFMLRRNYEQRSGVILDVCNEHGTWLDADELEQIRGFIVSGGLAEARASGKQQRDSEKQRRMRVQTAQVASARLGGAAQGSITYGREENPSLMDFLLSLLS
jgi:Zn-finger nucleic acid-binding protein